MTASFLLARRRHGEDEPYKDKTFEEGQATKQKEPKSSEDIQNRVNHQARLSADLCMAKERNKRPYYLGASVTGSARN